MATKSTTKKNETPSKIKGLPKPKNGVQYNQSELVNCLYELCNFSNKKVAKETYEGFVNIVQATLKKGYKLPLPGIGKIQVRVSQARTGRNPQTGEPIHIPSRKRVRLSVSKSFKEAVL